ncbi:MAG: diacylglycerol kinase family lipid kinase, partial [Oscillospiraceae bacterium]
MRKKVLLIYNPKAGKTGAVQNLSKVIQLLTEENCEVTVYPIVPDLDAEDILEQVGENFEYVVCCGGDGTLNHAINGLMEMKKPPLLGYIPSGSTNDFAISVGIKESLYENCRAIAVAKPFYYDIGKFGEVYFNYIAAFGAFTEVSYSTSQTQKNYLGHMAYIIEGMRHLPIGKSYTLKAKAQGKECEGNFIYGSVSNTTSVGGMSINKQDYVCMDDGLFEVLLIREPKNVIETQNIIAAILLQNFDSPFIEYFQTDKISFEFSDNVPWTLDGEYGG